MASNSDGSCSSSTAKSVIILTEDDIPGARLPREKPEECNVAQLKRWLLCRGACTTGLKHRLVTRFVICDLKLEVFLVQT